MKALVLFFLLIELLPKVSYAVGIPTCVLSNSNGKDVKLVYDFAGASPGQAVETLIADIDGVYATVLLGASDVGLAAFYGELTDGPTGITVISEAQHQGLSAGQLKMTFSRRDKQIYILSCLNQ